MDVPFKGVSFEPLWKKVEVSLAGFSIAFVGGESGEGAERFEIEWAENLRRQCAQHGVAFFLKQFGENPYTNGHPVKLKDGHGGDWSEWPEDLRVREFPAGFYRTTEVNVAA